MSDGWFKGRFARLARHRHGERWFLEDVALPCDGDEPLRADLIEIEPNGHTHLWMFSSLYARETARGDVVGRLVAFDAAWSSMPPEVLKARLVRMTRRRGDPHDHLPSPKRPPRLASWNIVLCGGEGWELAPGTSPLRRLYAALPGLLRGVDDVNTWHFYPTPTGLDLRSLWDLPPAAGEHRPSLAPDDDFDIAAKHDLRLRRRKGFHAAGLDAARRSRDPWQSLPAVLALGA